MGSLQRFLTDSIDELFLGSEGLIAAIEDLTLEELHFRAHEDTNAIGFNAWHVFRTADNIVHFVLLRERPVWLQQGLDETWGLPRNAQGTEMPAEEAHALRFPEASVLVTYGRDVAAAIRPRIEGFSDDFLMEMTPLRPFGEVTKLQAIGRSILTHGHDHLGQIDLARTLLGKRSLTF
ncbi:MAG: DinB family protein [Dehalococcoidia bacterium]|nr:DinB family protein [Dehalococcoidia bacterium]